MQKYLIKGMSCAACVARVERAVKKLEGVKDCSVSLLTNTMSVDGTENSENIIVAVKNAGYGIEIMGTTNSCEKDSSSLKTESSFNSSIQSNGYEEDINMLEDTETPALRKRLITSIIFLLILMYISMGHMMFHFPLPNFLNEKYYVIACIEMMLALIIMIINKKFFVNGFKALIRIAPNMDTLVAMGSFVSFAWSVYVTLQIYDAVNVFNLAKAKELMMNLYYESAAMIVTLITIGKMLEAKSKGKTTNALKELMKLTPSTATIIVDGKEKEINVQDIKVSDVVIVKPGESIPVDGVIIEGNTLVDESSISGESLPVDKKEKDNVNAATNNLYGVIKIEAKKVGKDTMISKIIEMTKNVNATKAPIAKIADKVSYVFVPTIILIAIITTIIWFMLGAGMGFSLARGISVLVVSCPCALGLATPVAIMVSTGVGAKNGILYKTATSIEELSRVKYVCLDKTGTITKGKPNVIEVKEYDEKLYDIVYNIEKNSKHPLAECIIEYIEKNNINVLENRVEDFVTLVGSGVKAKINEIEFFIGNERIIKENITISKENEKVINDFINKGMTLVIIASKVKLYGIFAISDVVKEDSKNAIMHMHEMGLKTCIITGDNKKVAKMIADKVGIDIVYSEVLPIEKEKIIKELQKNGKVLMVGDGINDTVALKRADVSMAIGDGSDIALGSSDIVLVKNSLMDAVNAIHLSKKTLKNIYENYFWAFFYNVLLIPIAAGVYISNFNIKMSPDFGALAMSLSSFCVVSNALRLNLIKLNKKEMVSMEKIIKVKGMMCPHCEKHVVDALLKIEGVTSAVASHKDANVKIVLSKEIDEKNLFEAIKNAGYEVF